MMRLHFLVHSFINIYVWDPVQKTEVLGYKMTNRNISTKQSHLLTIDKLVCEMPLGETFNPD